MSALQKLFIIVFIVFGCSHVAAQDIKPRVNGLERDSVYMSLLLQEQELKQREDSLVSVINAKRASFASDTTDRAVRGTEILRLEGRLFDTRSKLGIVASKANAIEQEFIMNNMGKQTVSPSPVESIPATNYTNLIRNDYFINNLPREEYDLLKKSQQMQPQFNKLAADFMENYQKIERLTAGYDSITSQRLSDSIYTEYRNLAEHNRYLEAELNTTWGDQYNHRIYSYALLLDKLNKTHILTALNEKEKAGRLSDTEKLMSQPFAEYPSQRLLVLAYELALADVFELTAASDSLRRVQETIDRNRFAVPKIAIDQKEYVTYADVTIQLPPVYTAAHPIPTVEIPPQGKYYSVTVGTFSSKPSPAVFKGATPLSCERLKNGQWRFFAGLFRCYGDAADAVQMLKNEGFRRPEPVVWEDGVYTNLADLASKNQGQFRVEIQGVRGELPDNIKYQIARYARNKEIIRVSDTYYVGVFTDKLQAGELVDVLKKMPGLGVSILNVEE